MHTFDLRKIGNNLLTIRKATGMTQAEVAELAGLSDRTYADIERGSTNMRADTILKICHALRITPNDILNEKESTEINSNELLERLKKCTEQEHQTAMELLSVYLRSIHK